MILHSNPFSAEPLERLAFRFPAGVTWESFLQKLATQNYCGAIVGSHGTGKTTLLRELGAMLVYRGFEPEFFHIAPESSLRDKDRLGDALRRVQKPGFILLDGAEQLSTRQWLSVRSAASQAAGFVVTVHRVSRLPALIECAASVDLLEDLVHELSGGTLPRHEPELLISRHRGNLKAIFRELEQRWAGAGG